MRNTLPPMPTAHKGVVFVADDEDALRDSTQDILEDAGYLVLSARNGTEALARMRGISGPAVAVIDLVMPGMDGWHLIEAMRADKNLAVIAVIVLTAHDGRDPVKGADRVIRKPYKPSELVGAVQDLCR